VATGRQTRKPLGGRRRFRYRAGRQSASGQCVKSACTLPPVGSPAAALRFGQNRCGHPHGPPYRSSSGPGYAFHSERITCPRSVSSLPTGPQLPGDPAERKLLLLHEESRPLVQVRVATISVPLENPMERTARCRSIDAGFDEGSLPDHRRLDGTEPVRLKVTAKSTDSGESEPHTRRTRDSFPYATSND
jgi:hypothetical protein